MDFMQEVIIQTRTFQLLPQCNAICCMVKVTTWYDEAISYYTLRMRITKLTISKLT
jgi:hypothetical protein